MRAVAVVLAGIAGAKVIVDDVTGQHTGTTNDAGYVEFMTSDLPVSYVAVYAAGYEDYYVGGLNFPPGNFQIRVGVDADPARPQDIILPGLRSLDVHENPSEEPPVDAVGLQISGVDLVDGNGNRVVLKGVDQFKAYAQYLNGDSSLTGLILESRELGFNLWRVFMMGSAAQNNILDLRPQTTPNYYDELRGFALFLKDNGINLLTTIFVDAQDVMPNADERRDHWGRVTNELRGMALVSGGNEWQKNGWNPNELTDPGAGVIWSRGSATSDQRPAEPYATFAEFHPRRDMPAMMLDSVASPVTLYGWGLNVPLLIDEPIGFAEADKPGSRSADPRMAYRLARHYSTETAGAVFHNDSGMRGQLMSPRIRECAASWLRGMRL